MAGSFGFDNVFMVNGVDINDNIQGTPNNLFIEDAIQETAVLAHGISAEYGRFSGGVVNVVTRSGGNFFSGSFREGLSNPSWVTQTPLERAEQHQARRHPQQDARGHVRRPGAARPPLVLRRRPAREGEHLRTRSRRTAPATPRTDTNRRGEVKFTGTLAPTPDGAGQLHRQRDARRPTARRSAPRRCSTPAR